MKTQFDNQITTSFIMWLDHEILVKGEAFSNVPATFYSGQDGRFSAYSIFASPYKQWVWDESISGASVVSGVFVSGGAFLARGQSGLMLDFFNGRILLDSGVPTNSVFTGTLPVKDFNIYATTKADEELIFNSRYEFKKQVYQEKSGIPPYIPVLPAIFVRMDSSENIPFALGGEENTKIDIKITVISDTAQNLSSVLSIIRDGVRRNIVSLPLENSPLDIFGDKKSGVYNYQNLCNLYGQASNLIHVEKIETYVMKGQRSPDDGFIGFADVRLEKPRFPRA